MKKIRINIKKFQICISTDILIPLILFSIIGKQKVFIIALIFTFLHELAHFAVAKILGYMPEKISINMCGDVLHFENMDILPEHVILINIAGPFFNLFVSFIMLVLSMEGIIPSFGNVMMINAVLGFYNLLPFYPLDGGKIIFIYLKYFMDESAAAKLIYIFAKIFLFFNFFLGIYLVQYNLLNLFICLLSISIFAELKREEQSKLYASILKVKKEQESRNYV